jgi:hypothetical protein
MKYHIMDKDLSKYPFPCGLVDTKDTEDEAKAKVKELNDYYMLERFYICEEA